MDKIVHKQRAGLFPIAMAVLLVCSVPMSFGCATKCEASESEKEQNRYSKQMGIPAAPVIASTTQRYKKEYVLVPADVIDVVVFKHPVVSRSCVIRPDGYISLPILDDIKAAGLTPRELDATLTELFSRRLSNPEVTIIVTQMRPTMIYVIGEVRQPAAMPLNGPMTVLHAVTQAGGFTTKSLKRDVILIRLTEDDCLTAFKIDVQKKKRGGAYLALNNQPLQADDIIFVPKRPISILSTFLNENINPILSMVNSGLSTYSNFKLLEYLDAQ